jgi:GT2 family glycosyltransferase
MINASIVTYNTDFDELSKAVLCLQRVDFVQKIYIVDNSPNDDLRNRLCNMFSKVQYIWGHGNIGYGAGNNIAIRESVKDCSEYHLVMNSDVYFNDGTLENILAYMDEDSTIGQLLPQVLYPDGKLQYLCKLIPTPLDLLSKRFLPNKYKKKKPSKFLLEFTDYQKPMNVPYLSGCFMFFRVSALKEVGLFDERFFMYPEDIDITRRMHKHYKTMYYPNETIIHVHAAESYKSIKMLFIHASNMIKYFNKWGWLFDIERKNINKTTLEDLGYKKK